MRDSGEDEHARTVQGLPKPKLSVWVVNQLARTDSALVLDLLQATERLEARGDLREVREATTERQKVVRRLVDRAAAVLSAAGHRPSANTLEEVRRTLQAATGENDRALLEQGTLTEPIEASGFGPAPAPDLDTSEPGPSAEEKRRELELVKLHEDLERARQAAAESVAEARLAREAAEVAERRERSDAEELSRLEEEIERLG